MLIRRAQGRLDAAVLTCEQALDSLVTSGRPLPAAGPSYVGLAEIAYQRDELDIALRHATEGIALCRQFVYTTPLANGLATLAMIRQATGDPAGALEAITEAGQASPAPAGPAQPGPRPAGPAAAGPGRPGRAARFPQENGLGPDDEPDYAREPGHLVLARILLAQDRPGQALALLDRLHAAAAAQDRTGSLIETGALRALALAATGDEAGAVTALAEALMLACPQGHVRVFADEGPPMAALLGQLVAAQRAGQAAAGVPLGYLARLQRAFGAGHPAPRPGRGAVAARHRRPADQPRAGGAGDAGGGPVEPGHRRRARGHPRHRQEARRPCPGQARRGQPHRGRCPGTRAEPDPLTAAYYLRSFAAGA